MIEPGHWTRLNTSYRPGSRRHSHAMNPPELFEHSFPGNDDSNPYYHDATDVLLDFQPPMTPNSMAQPTIAEDLQVYTKITMLPTANLDHGSVHFTYESRLPALPVTCPNMNSFLGLFPKWVKVIDSMTMATVSSLIWHNLFPCHQQVN
jgi:hypothetical protein